MPEWYRFAMAMNFRPSAAQDGISMQEAALAAIDAHTSRRGQRLRVAITMVATEDAELLKRLAQ